MYQEILKEINNKKNHKRAKSSGWFFKTNKGDYGEGDKFLGLDMASQRAIAKSFADVPFKDIQQLLEGGFHEERMVGVLILVYKYKTATKKDKSKIFEFYLKNTKYVNNWDLVDASAHHLVGDYLLDNKKDSKRIFSKLSKSGDLWEERIAMVATMQFIKKGELDWTFKLAETFLNHSHDLIHKASGWMLREAGKRDEKELRKFLDKNIKKMPRTMLRYSIEKFPEKLRKDYLRIKKGS